MKTALLSMLDSRISWRRLLVFAASSALLWVDKIDQDTWLWVAIAFIGGESAVRLAEAARGRRPAPAQEPS